MDADALAAFALQVWSYKQGEVVAFSVHLGDRLGLYRAMDGAGRLTAGELAERTGLEERWLLEWLRTQGAARLLETDDGEHFELTDVAAEVLAHEDESPWFAAGAFTGLAATPEVADRLVDAFRTGRGLTYEELGAAGATAIDRLTRPWTAALLVPAVLPRLDGVTERLERGARVVDVGCGIASALVSMASAFPASRFEGIDPSRTAIELGAERVAAAGVDNVELRCEPATSLPASATYDLVLTLDCLHDLPRPRDAIAAVRRCLRDDGVWLVKDIRSSAAWSDNLRNPVLALLYGTSVTTCLSSALSEPGGEGLGTVGLHPELLERWCREAGFSSFAVHDVDDPANLYYEVRP